MSFEYYIMAIWISHEAQMKAILSSYKYHIEGIWGPHGGDSILHEINLCKYSWGVSPLFRVQKQTEGVKCPMPYWLTVEKYSS